MFGISPIELGLVALFAFVIFGPDKLPQMARTVSKAIKTFRRTQQDMERLIKVEMYAADPEKENSPFAPKDPFAAPTASAEAKAAKPATVAAGLYAVTDEDEEEEDEE